jgi:hypothetical protein
MFLCAFVAFLGAGVTYIFTPRYGAVELESEEQYIQLEHRYHILSHKLSHRRYLLATVPESFIHQEC